MQLISTERKLRAAITLLTLQLSQTQKLLAQVVNDPGNDDHGQSAAEQFKENQDVLEYIKQGLEQLT